MPLRLLWLGPRARRKDGAMKFYTSNFRKSGRDPAAVAISLGVPKWFHKRRYLHLAPDRDMIQMTDEQEYRRRYAAILAKLDVHQVARDLGPGAVLLCWEPEEKFCHRHLVAEWLCGAGHEVEERTDVYEREQPGTPGLFDAVWK